MVVYTVYTIHGARCAVCKRWIKEVISKVPKFPDVIECTCTTKYTPRQLVNEMNAKTDVKEFDSDKLYKHIVQQYLDKKSSMAHATEVACRVIAREKERFEKKYGFGNEQRKLM